MDINLDPLKQEISGYLDSTDFAVFRSVPGGLEDFPMVSWDCRRYPDYRMFLEAARTAGVKLILFASREFEREDLDDAQEQLEDCELSRDERRDFERRLRVFDGNEGVTCSLELAFDHDGRMYVYELYPDWYEAFLALCDEFVAYLPDLNEEEEEDDGIGGFYSNN